MNEKSKNKNIILLSDGTGNSNIKDRGTNVYKLYEALDCNGLHGSQIKQVAFYDDGVGTEELKPLKILAGAFGWGLARNVRNLYKRLVQVYEPGDKIYLFGFSRGAFTVRTLVGLIAAEGILDITHYPTDKVLDLAVLQLYEGYRAKNTALLENVFYKPWMELFFNAYGEKTPVIHAGKEAKQIEFIGVWDTVDAVGLPFDKATEAWNALIFRFKFSDHKLHPNIKRACHALAIDDERQSFHPLLWESDHERIEQVWFPGVHANVGGGYPQQGLSLVTLEWMIKRAEAAGLQFIPNVVTFVHDQKYACDKLYDSRSGLGVYYQYLPRDISKFCHKNGIEVPQIHVSVFERIAGGILGYAPGNLPDKFDVVDDGHPQSLAITNTAHPNSSQMLNLISASPAKSLSPLLLQKANHYIRGRRCIYYTFLAYSVCILYLLVRNDIKDMGFWESLPVAVKALVAPESLLTNLGHLLSSSFGLVLVPIGVGIFWASFRVRKSMETAFSTFWSGKRHTMKNLL
jgi:uncharacterized protein (DUF2235 family)